MKFYCPALLLIQPASPATQNTGLLRHFPRVFPPGLQQHKTPFRQHKTPCGHIKHLVATPTHRSGNSEHQSSNIKHQPGNRKPCIRSNAEHRSNAKPCLSGNTKTLRQRQTLATENTGLHKTPIQQQKTRHPFARLCSGGGPKGQLAAHPAAAQFMLDNAANVERRGGLGHETTQKTHIHKMEYT